WRLEADQLHLKNAINSLLDNSLKYSDKGVRIRLEAREEIDSYLLQISDNGKGIPKAYQQKVFERFFRVPKGDVHNVKGYGLGLSYVQEIVQAHRGTIRLSSQPGVGTTIQIRLPKTHES
ncbi:MAG: ATP-binding protein, partial [Phaeodactylibacter sp.]|nr:ATP-binding protein [Phaeodactylibacter sp.]